MSPNMDVHKATGSPIKGSPSKRTKKVRRPGKKQPSNPKTALKNRPFGKLLKKFNGSSNPNHPDVLGKQRTESPSKLLSKHQKKAQQMKSEDPNLGVQSTESKTYKTNVFKGKPKKSQTDETENKGNLQGKLGRVLKLKVKKKKAQKAREKHTMSNVPETELSSELNSKKKTFNKLVKEKRQKINVKSSTQKIKIAKARDGNEIVPREKKKKMRKRTNKSLKGKLETLDNRMALQEGTENPSFDCSTLEEPMQLSVGKSQNGELPHLDSKSPSIISGVGVSADKLKRLRKLVAISKELNASSGNEKTTLQHLKNNKSPGNKKTNHLKIKSGNEKITLHNLKNQTELKIKKGLSSKRQKLQLSLRERMTEHLKSSRFRWINEQLYLSNSWEALSFFKEEPEAYEDYHSGFRNQVSQWPINPVDVISKSISRLPKNTVVVDFGCGDAKLAESLPNLKFHSLDLVASKPGVIACDMAHSPILMASVDVAVFCLSLMGSNLNDFILEANRVLKMGGLLMIAEVESRFESLDTFIEALSKFGFELIQKNVSHKMFVFMELKKKMSVSKTGKLPLLELNACAYKKR